MVYFDNLNTMDPEIMQRKIDYSFYMNVANCMEYPEDVRSQAKEQALSIGMQLGLVPVYQQQQPEQTFNNSDEFLGPVIR